MNPNLLHRKPQGPAPSHALMGRETLKEFES
jgi:hypothetical protein